jgi:hypothetical protein
MQTLIRNVIARLTQHLDLLLETGKVLLSRFTGRK